jgi:thiamine biosynthesis lipoprotein
MTASDARGLCRVEHHMTTAISLLGSIDDTAADAFFARIRHLEDVLSRFREQSDVSRLARNELGLDDVDPAVRLVLSRCQELRELTNGDFEHEPRRHSEDRALPTLDLDAVAKGWIIEDAATALRMHGHPFLVNAGGDVLARATPGAEPWRVGIQHPADRTSIIGTFEVNRGAVATSGTYERGAHLRTRADRSLSSVTVVGPDLAHADGLSTAVFASGQSPPPWWNRVDPAYGLLTMSDDGRVRWLPPRDGEQIEWHFPPGTNVRAANVPTLS